MFGRAKHQDTPSQCGVDGCTAAATSVWRQGYVWEPDGGDETTTIRYVVPMPLCDAHFAFIRRMMGMRDSETTGPELYVYTAECLEETVRLTMLRMRDEGEWECAADAG